MEIICYRCRKNKDEYEFERSNVTRSGRRITCKTCEGKPPLEIFSPSAVLEYDERKNDIVMAESFSEPKKLYFIFRSVFEQVSVRFEGKSYSASHPLFDYERIFIKERFNL